MNWGNHKKDKMDNLNQQEEGKIVKNTGGYAFPQSGWDVENTGLTIRDYFAGQALMGQLAFSNSSQYETRTLALKCYSIADEMIEVRDSQ